MASSEDLENEDFTSPPPGRSELDERRHTGYPEYSVWKRGRPEIVSTKGRYFLQKRHHPEEVFDDYVYANMDLDLDTKKAALLVSPSVVSLVSLRGGNVVFMASGTILESTQEVDGKYINTVLTSASLLDSSGGDCVTVKVYLYDGLDFDASVVAYDPHYNLALISIKSEATLPTATLRCLDDTYEDSRRGDKFGIRPRQDSDSFKICPGEMVVALGRGVRDSYLMVAPGQYSLEVCTYDCKELMRATCKISKCGIGGPLINYRGEVIGLTFYDGFCTPFLPTNMVSKFLEHFKKHGRFRRLLHGIEGMNLYEARVKIIAMVIPKFQDSFKGVVVRKIVPGSSADSAGLRPNDVIVQCSGNIVTSWFEFFGQMWDKAGESVDLSVIRKRTDGILKLSMVVADDNSPDKFYSWPVPKEANGYVKRMRTLKLKSINLISREPILF